MLIMMVLERTKEIAILKVMGASEKSIHLIFLIEGLGIAFLGSLGGAVVGFLFCEVLLGQGISLDPQVYGIDHFPVVFNGWDYIYSTLGALLIIGFAVHFPARRGSQLKPTDGLREDHLDR
jgi:lipoprotein-releasing system permease protein